MLVECVQRNYSRSPFVPLCVQSFVCLTKDGIFTTDESRRTQEALPSEMYSNWSYYEKWSAAMATLLCDKGVLQQSELQTELFGDDVAPSSDAPRFASGDRVVVRSEENLRTRWRRPHLRTPGYIYGAPGVIERCCGSFADPSLLAFGVKGAQKQPLYRVRFLQCDLWPEVEGSSQDSVVADVYESWLIDPAQARDDKAQARPDNKAAVVPRPHADYSQADASHHHDEHHGHVHCMLRDALRHAPGAPCFFHAELFCSPLRSSALHALL